MAKKRLFNEDIAYSQILRISENSKKNIEAERDERIASNPEKEEEISVEYRNKLQSIYRIRNNAFALMLRQGFECYAVKSKDGEENNIFVILPGEEGKKYEIDILSLRNVLYKDAESVLKNVLDTEKSEVSLEDIMSFKKSNKQKSVEKKETVKEEKEVQKVEINKDIIPVANTATIDMTSSNLDDFSTEDMLAMMDDVVQEKPSYPLPEKTSDINLDLMPIFSEEEVKEEEPSTEEEFALTEEVVEDMNKFFDNVEHSEPKKIEEIKTESNIIDSDDDFMIVDESFEFVDEAKEDDDLTIIEEEISVPTNEETVPVEEITGMQEQSVEEVTAVKEPAVEEKVEEETINFFDDDEFAIVDESSNEQIELIDEASSEESTTIDASADEEMSVEDALAAITQNSFVQVQEPTVEEISVPEEIIKVVKSDDNKRSVCPHCRTNVSEGDTICPKCGFDLINTKITESELKDADDEEQFDEDDIKRILAEIKADYENAKRQEEEDEQRRRQEEEEAKKASEPKYDLSSAPKEYAKDILKNVKMFSPNESDPVKLKAELICDIYHIKAYDPELVDEEGNVIPSERQIRDITAYLFPLHIPTNGNERISECAVFIEEDNKFGCYCNPYRKPGSIKANTAYHSFLFQWNWIEGVPQSRFIQGAEAANIIEATKTEIRPSDISVVGYGHPYLTLSIKYADGEESMSIHALTIPDTENDSDGNVKCLFILEDLKEQARELMAPRPSNYSTIFGFEEKLFKIACKDLGNSVELVLNEQAR